MSNVEVTTVEKERFAEAWLKHADRYKAAYEAFPLLNGSASYLADTLVNDPETIEIRDRILSERGGKSAFLPDKEDVARMALEIANERQNEDWKHSAHSRLNALRFYAELQGHIEPKGSRSDHNDAPNATKAEILEAIADKMPD